MTSRRDDCNATACTSEHATSLHHSSLGRGGRLAHFCSGALCCDSVDVYKRRAQQHILDIVYRFAPTVPTKSKWTKTGPCIDFHMLAQGFDLLGRQFALAFGGPKGMRVHIVKASGFEDQLIAEEISWHRVAGIRSAKAQEMLSDPQSYFRIAILAIVLEPIRYLTRWFMVEGSDRRRRQRQKLGLPPGLCDLVADTTSPGTAVLHYYAELLVGGPCSTRLRLLFLRAGCASFEAWAAEQPGLVCELRRCILCAASWVYVRHVSVWRRWPFELARVVDCRLSQSERLQTARGFCQSPHDLVDGPFSHRLQEKIAGPKELFEEHWQGALSMWAGTVRLSISACEFLHGRNRRRAVSSQRFDNFAAARVLAEMALRRQSSDRDGKDMETSGHARAVTQGPPPPSRSGHIGNPHCSCSAPTTSQGRWPPGGSLTWPLLSSWPRPRLPSTLCMRTASGRTR